jgi:hypothetical protein
MSTLSKDTATTLPVVLAVVGIMGFLTVATAVPRSSGALRLPWACSGWHGCRPLFFNRSASTISPEG